MDSGYVGPNPSENGVVAGDGWKREIGGVEDGEEPFHVSDRGFQKVGDFPEVGGGCDGEHVAEDTSVFELADKGQGSFQVFRYVGGNSTEWALVEGLSGGVESDGGSEQLGELHGLFSEFGAFEFG